MKWLVLASLVSAAVAFTAPQTALRTVRATVSMKAAPSSEAAAQVAPVVAGALPALLVASPASAALPDIAGIPGGVVLTFFPLIIAATVAILVIGPGALQQFQRVFSGQSAKYMKGDY